MQHSIAQKTLTPVKTYSFRLHVTVHLLVLHLAFAQHEKAATIKQDKLYKKYDYL